MKQSKKIRILVTTLNQFYREDRGEKAIWWREMISDLDEEYPDVNWMQTFIANIEQIKSGEKKLSLNKKLKKINVVRVLLDETDFKNLVSGEIIKKESVEITLQDIGYQQIMEYLLKNMK